MKRIAALVARRLLGAIPVLAIVIVGAFLMLELAPGDAVSAYLVTTGGGDAEMIAALRREWGLDQSAAARLWLFVSHLAAGDLGWSILFSRPVGAVIADRLPNTLLLMTGATALSFLLGSALGIVAGTRPRSFVDRALSTVSLAVYAIPGFWFGLGLLILFAIQLRWFPLSGVETIASGLTGWARARDIAWHLVLPVLSLGLVYLALYLRMMRAGMAEAWRCDFVRALRARGLGRGAVRGHVVRNALLPLVTMLGIQSAAMLGGSVVIESVFAIPGLGRLAYEAVDARDTPLLLGVVVISAIFVVAINLLIDILYLFLDPRIGATGDAL